MLWYKYGCAGSPKATFTTIVQDMEMYQSHIEAVGFLLSTHATSLHMVGETSLCTDHTYRWWRRDSLSFPALWSLVLPPAFTLQGYASKYVVKVLSISIGPLFSLYCIIWSTYYCAYGLGTCLGYLEQARSLSICAPWQWMFLTSSNNTCTRSL
jgi:hypothetical protein